MSQSTESTDRDDPMETLRENREILETIAEKDSPLSKRAEAALELLDKDAGAKGDHS